MVCARLNCQRHKKDTHFDQRIKINFQLFAFSLMLVCRHEKASVLVRLWGYFLGHFSNSRNNESISNSAKRISLILFKIPCSSFSDAQTASMSGSLWISPIVESVAMWWFARLIQRCLAACSCSVLFCNSLIIFFIWFPKSYQHCSLVFPCALTQI